MVIRLLANRNDAALPLCFCTCLTDKALILSDDYPLFTDVSKNKKNCYWFWSPVFTRIILRHVVTVVSKKLKLNKFAVLFLFCLTKTLKNVPWWPITDGSALCRSSLDHREAILFFPVSNQISEFSKDRQSCLSENQEIVRQKCHKVGQTQYEQYWKPKLQ